MPFGKTGLNLRQHELDHDTTKLPGIVFGPTSQVPTFTGSFKMFMLMLSIAATIYKSCRKSLLRRYNFCRLEDGHIGLRRTQSKRALIDSDFPTFT
jgi:hypothetical protein